MKLKLAHQRNEFVVVDDSVPVDVGPGDHILPNFRVHVEILVI